MTDEIDWLAVGSWSVAATYQFGMAIRDILKKRFGKRTEFQRIMDGEIKKGWKLALPRDRMDLSYQEQSTYVVVQSMDPEIFPDPTAPLGSSITLMLEQPLLKNGQISATIYQYSLVRNGVRRQLLNHTFNWNQYELQFACYLTPRTIILLLHDVRQSHIRFKYHLMLVDCATRETQSYYINSPRTYDAADMEGYFAYLDEKKRLHIVFGQGQAVESRAECYDVVYDLSFGPSHRGNPTRPRSWGSISIPVGNRRDCFFRYCGSSAIFVIHHPNSLTGRDLCISFDRKTWALRTVAEWIDSLRNSSRGVRYLDAIRAFISIEPPGTDQLTDVLAASFLDWSPMYLMGEAVLVPVDYQCLLSRWITPPPLKRLAAEAFFKANPNLQISSWKAVIGFEMIDGLDEDEEENESCLSAQESL